MGLAVHNLLIRKGTFCFRVDEFHAEPGELITICGASGSGKSTFLSALAGFSEVTSGAITLDGANVLPYPPEKRKMAYLFQKPALFPHMNVRENVEFALRVQGIERATRSSVARLWLEQFRILHLESRKPQELSGGQAQRVALARAMAAGFPVLLLDEPFTGLESELKEELREMVFALTKEKKCLTVLVSHEEEDWAMADHLYLCESGQLLLTQRT